MEDLFLCVPSVLSLQGKSVDHQNFFGDFAF